MAQGETTRGLLTDKNTEKVSAQRHVKPTQITGWWTGGGALCGRGLFGHLFAVTAIKVQECFCDFRSR